MTNLSKKFRCAFTALKLHELHPIIKYKKITCSKIFEEHFKDCASYDRIMSRFKKLITTIKNSDTEYIDIKKRIESFNCSMIKICYENNLDSFTMSKSFITNYCNDTIQNILNAFSFLNNYDTWIKYSVFIDDTSIIELQRTLDTFLIYNLAKIFSIIDQCEKISKNFKLSMSSILSMYKKIPIIIVEHIAKHDCNNLIDYLDLIHDISEINILNAVWKTYEDVILDLLSKSDKEIMIMFDNNLELSCVSFLSSSPVSDFARLDIRIKNLFSIKNFYYTMHLLQQIKYHAQDQTIDLCAHTDNIENHVTIEI